MAILKKKKKNAKTKKKAADPIIAEYIDVLKDRVKLIPGMRTRANMKETQLYNNGQVVAINQIIVELEELA